MSTPVRSSQPTWVAKWLNAFRDARMSTAFLESLMRHRHIVEIGNEPCCFCRSNAIAKSQIKE
jgi:hypothetical protein